MDSRLMQSPLPLIEQSIDDEITCVWPDCGKYRQAEPPSIYCPLHQVTAEWIADEPERKKRRAKRLREMRKLKEKLLAESPLAVKLAPQSVTEPPQQRRCAK